MTQDLALAALTEEIARAVREVPGVAFLKPALTGLLHSAASRTPQPAAPLARAGVRVIRPSGAEPWDVDVRLVALRHARAVDVARAARRAVEARMTALVPAQETPARVSVTVTGLV
ncbi:hypothetical protein ABZT03_08535 [Streptomyces sp. NPDC005574]|uniref:hypothetical protein n=1 Tax=Streptomyces sp. NPDC005574 TaxID=3156891 RepID=UPI0033BBCA98